MSGLLLVKLGRDLRTSWPRFVLMVAAISITLTAFAAVLFAWSASGRETTRAYASTAPASATLLLDQAVPADRLAVIADDAASLPGVLSATGRTQFSSDVEVNGEPRSVPLQVFVAAADDPMRLARFFPQATSWPPAEGEVFIGQDSLELLGVAIGDTVTVQTPSGQRRDLLVADTVYDPSLSPSPQEQTGRGYVTAASLAGPDGQVLLDQLKIQVTAGPGSDEPSADRSAIAQAAARVGDWLQAQQGLPVREIQVPEPYAHPHQWQADALLLSLLAGGAAALLLACVLVATMLNILFTQQIPQIGILKAIGAGSWRIGRLYLTMTLLVAAAATVLALAPAILLGRLAVGNFLAFLGVAPQSLSAPWWAYLVVLAVGLTLPSAMALVPLLKASRTSVRMAIDHHGVSARPRVAGGLVTALSRIRRVDRTLLLALRNTIRRPARFVLSVGLLASAGTVFVAGMSLSAGVAAIEEEQRAGRIWDVDVQLAVPAPAQQVKAVVDNVAGVAWTEAYTVLPTGVAPEGDIPVTRTYPDQGHGRIAVTAVPDDSTTFTAAPLLEGRGLRPGETGAVVLNQLTRENAVPGVRVGDTVQLILAGAPTTWRVVGLVEERQGGGGGVYTTAAGLSEALRATPANPSVNQLRIATQRHDERTRQQVATAVDRALRDAGFEVTSAASISRAEAVSAGHLGPVVLILVAIALPLGVVGLIGLASTMSANVLDRTREFAVMHAVGAPPRTVRRIVIAEGIILAATSCLAAVLPALGLAAILGAGLGDLFFSAPLPYRVSLPAAGLWAVIALLGAALATDTAATRAARTTIREALTAT